MTKQESVNGYSEYGYRGLEELRQKDALIDKLKKEIEELKARLAPGGGFEPPR